MPTYFDTISANFADVPVGPDGIDTIKFLEACDALVAMFGLFNSTAFNMVVADISQNIQKVRARYLAHSAESSTIELLVKNEQGEKKRVATEGLLWLTRGLKFTYVGLQRSYDNPSEELSTSFTKSYEETLRQYHSMFVRPVFTLAMKACPYRSSLLTSLGTPEDRVLTQLEAWLVGLGELVGRVEKAYEREGWGKGL